MRRRTFSATAALVVPGLPGRIAAEGSPSELINRYSTKEVLELRFQPGAEKPDLERFAEALVAVS